MIGFLSGFGFSAPYLLAGVPLAVGLLVYAYLKRGRGDRKPVATIFLLRRLKTTMAARKNFVPPPRFFFELLLLLLLGAAAAGMYRKGPDEKIAVLFDNSLSMFAQPNPGDTRLEVAKRDCRSYLGSLPERTRVAFYVTSPALREIREELLTGEQAQAVLENVTAAYAPDALESALGKLAQDARYDRVVAWADKGLASPNTRIQVRNQLSGGSSNVALRSLRTEARAEKGNVIIVEVGSFAPRDTPVKAVFSALSTVTGSTAAVKIGEQTATLPAGGGKTMEFPAGTTAAAGFIVQLEVPNSAANLNSLREDDAGYLATAPSSDHLTVVSALSAQSLGAARLHAFDTAVISPAQYASAPVRDGVTVFHRNVPDDLPATNSLFVLPPPRSKLGGDLVQGQIEVTHWSESHPIVNYLNVPLLSLRSLVPLQKPDWAQELIASTRGTAAFVGEYRGRRYAALGFELFPFEGKREPVLSILLLNILKWLSGSALSSGYEMAPYVLPATKGITAAEYLAGPWKGPVPTERGQRVATTPGLIQITGSKGTVVQAVNFFDEDESNTLTVRKVSVPEVTVQADTAVSQNLPLTNTILWAVLLLAAADVAALMFAARKQRGQTA